MSFRLDRKIENFTRAISNETPFARLSIGGLHIALSKKEVDDLEKAIKKFKEDEANVWCCYCCDNVDIDEFSMCCTCKLTGKIVDAYYSCENHNKR